MSVRTRKKKGAHKHSVERVREYRQKQPILLNFHIINISLTYINKNELNGKKGPDTRHQYGKRMNGSARTGITKKK